MNLRALRIAAAVAAATATLSGCSVLGIDLNGDKVQYESSNSRANLEVPPDLTPVKNENRFQVPSRQGAVSANAEAARVAAAAEDVAKGNPTASKIVPSTERVKVMREGSDRWLRVQASPEELWSVVQDFWPSVGLVVREQNAKTGYMETEWAENRAKLPQDIIRRTIGKVIDFAYSTGEQDQYRTRMERNADGTTDIFISHRSMVEVVTGAQKDTTLWQPGPTDPTMETEMLKRLALHIENEFNPDTTVAESEQAEKRLAEEMKTEPAPERLQVVTNASGVTESVVLKEGFDQAWRHVGLVLDRMGFEQTDRDRTAGWFLVRYLDPKYEAEQKEKRGFFTNLFSSDAAIEAPEYRIYLADDGSNTRVTVLGAEGGEDETGVAPNILNLLAEQLR